MKEIAFLIVTMLLCGCDGISTGEPTTSTRSNVANSGKVEYGSPKIDGGTVSLSGEGSGCEWKTSEEINEQIDGKESGRIVRVWHGKCEWQPICSKDSRSYALPASSVDSDSIRIINRSSSTTFIRSTREYKSGNYIFDVKNQLVTFEPAVCPFKGDIIELSFTEISRGVTKDIKLDLCTLRDTPCPLNCPPKAEFTCQGTFAGKQVIRDNLTASCATTCVMMETFLNDICGKPGTYKDGEIIPFSKSEIASITCTKK